MNLRSNIDVRGIPEILADARTALAKLLRKHAKGESLEVRRFAERVAAELEVGK